MSGNFGGFSIARGRNRWGYKNPFLYPSKIISSKNILDRTRTFWVPLSSGSAKSGTTLPTLAARGATSQYRAWSFLNGIDSAVVFDLGTLSDSENPLSLPNQFNQYSFGLTIYSLAAGTGGSSWSMNVYDRGSATTVYAINMTTVYPGVNYLFNHTAIDSWASPGNQNPYINASGPSLTSQPWMLEIKRTGTNAFDTYAASAGLVGINVSYTADM